MKRSSRKKKTFVVIFKDTNEFDKIIGFFTNRYWTSEMISRLFIRHKCEKEIGRSELTDKIEELRVVVIFCHTSLMCVRQSLEFDGDTVLGDLTECFIQSLTTGHVLEVPTFPVQLKPRKGILTISTVLMSLVVLLFVIVFADEFDITDIVPEFVEKLLTFFMWGRRGAAEVLCTTRELRSGLFFVILWTFFLTSLHFSSVHK